MSLIEAIRYSIKQHNDGVKLVDLLDDLETFVEDETLTEGYTIEDITDAIDETDDIDYLIYGSDKLFVHFV